MPIENLPYDLLQDILQHLSDDYRELYTCSLVNWHFNQVASKLLYARAEYSPAFRPVLDLKDRGEIPESSLLRSACIAGHAPLVYELKISGYLSTRPPPMNVLPSAIANAIRSFTNLSRLTLTPSTYHESMFVESLQILSQEAPRLFDLAVNPSCMGDLTAPLLVRINHLHSLTLSSPGRTILNLLPEWLERLPMLIGLHLKDNCGSITPGVLTSFIPYVHSRLRELTIGLSYSLTDKDVFSFLEQLPCLEWLQLRYYLQLRTPPTLNLSTLKSFTVNYPPTQNKRNVVSLCKWVKAVVSASSIQQLRLLCDSADPGPNVPFDNLINHLVKQHSKTLQHLDLRSAYVSVDGVKALFSGCLDLETFHIAARESALDTFQQYSSGMKRLHTAAFDTRNKRKRKDVVDQELAAKIISGGASLRRLIVNESKLEGSWGPGEGERVYFIVTEVP